MILLVLLYAGIMAVLVGCITSVSFTIATVAFCAGWVANLMARTARRAPVNVVTALPRAELRLNVPAKYRKDNW